MIFDNFSQKAKNVHFITYLECFKFSYLKINSQILNQQIFYNSLHPHFSKFSEQN
jgi:hypothetical protein